MNVPITKEMDFNGKKIFAANFIGYKTVKGKYCKCYQPSFADCTLVRCEPADGSDVLFLNAKDF